MKILKALALLAIAATAAFADVPSYQGVRLSTTTGQADSTLSGRFKVASSSQTASTFTITLDGPSGGILASSGTFTATGNSQYSIWTSSGINVAAGGVYAAFMKATTFIGNVIGNVTGTATSVAAGGVGQLLYQLSSGVTAFLPSMSSGGILIGNGVGVVPSTATLQGTSGQVVVTQSASAVTLSLPATINVATSGNAATATALAALPTPCSAGNYPLGILANGNSTGCTAAGIGTVTTTAGAVAGGTTRFTGSTNISTGAFTDNGNTVTAPSGKALVMAAGSTVTFSGSVQGTVAVSTAGYFYGGTASVNTYGPCVGSTFTVTTGNFPLEFTGVMTGDSSGTGVMAWWILMDGAPVDDFSASKTMGRFSGNSSGSVSSVPIIYQTKTAVAAGSHQFCVTGVGFINAMCDVSACFMRIKEAK